MALKKTSRKSVILTQRDIDLLKYLWWWKCSTFSAISDIYFSKTHPIKAYRRLMKLKRFGFVDQKVNNHFGKNLFVLAPLGFERILGHLPELKESGYKSENLDHDFLVSAIHQGECYKACPADMSIVTEQMLRRAQPEALPLWVPKGTLHRPDGYWYVSHEKGGQAIALEVELSRKERSRYAEVQRYFEDQNHVSDVIWIVSNPSLLRSIQEGLASGRRLHLEKHSFVLLEDALNLMWHSPIVNGKYEGHTIQNMFNLIRGKSMEHSLGQTPGQNGLKVNSQVNPHVLLDGRKSPRKPSLSLSSPNQNLILTPQKPHPYSQHSSTTSHSQAPSINPSQSVPSPVRKPFGE